MYLQSALSLAKLSIFRTLLKIKPKLNQENAQNKKEVTKKLKKHTHR